MTAKTELVKNEATHNPKQHDGNFKHRNIFNV